MPSKFVTKSGTRSKAVLTKINQKRAKGASWGAIAKELEVAPRTVRRLYDELNGAGAHYESRLAGKGGRTRQAVDA
jgi:predicted ArsR family transcriptional regulator